MDSTYVHLKLKITVIRTLDVYTATMYRQYDVNTVLLLNKLQPYTDTKRQMLQAHYRACRTIIFCYNSLL